MKKNRESKNTTTPNTPNNETTVENVSRETQNNPEKTEKEREVKTMKENTKKNANTDTETTENPYEKYIDMVNTLMSECGLQYEYKANQNRHFYYNPDLMKSVQRQFLFTYSKKGVRIATREEYNTLYEGTICKYNLPLAIQCDYSKLRNVVLHLRKGYKDTMKALEKEKKEREKEAKKESA